MKKSLKIFALAASLLQAALFSAFAANPPSDFKYELTKDNKAVKITGVRNDKAEYVIPASIEDFPVTEIEFANYGSERDDRLTKSCTISLPEGIEIAHIRAKEEATITLSQLPSTLKDLIVDNCVKYDGTFPDKIERIFLDGFYTRDTGGLKLKQSLQDFAELQNLKYLNLGSVDFIGVPNKAPFKKADMESLRLYNVNLIGNKTIYIPSDKSKIEDTNVEEIIFEEGVTKIDESFSNNKNLKKIVLPSTLKSVDLGTYRYSGKFVDCPNLTEVVVPDSLKNVKVPRIDESSFDIISGYMNYSYRDARIEDMFDTTSLSLKSRIKLKAAFGFRQ